MTDVKEQLCAYFDEVDPPFNTSDLVNDPRAVLVSRPGVVGRGVLVAGVAAIVLVLAVGLPLLFLANRPPTAVEPSATTTEAPTTTTEPTMTTSAATTEAADQVIGSPPEAPAEIFSWGEDDISDWVTEDEMAAVLEDLSIEYAGMGLVGEVEFESIGFVGVVRDAVVWTVGSVNHGNRWEVSVHNGDHISRGSADFSEDDLKLPEGGESGGWVVYRVRGPNSGESFCISVHAPTQFSGTTYFEENMVEMVSAVASMMLEELGWVD